MARYSLFAVAFRKVALASHSIFESKTFDTEHRTQKLSDRSEVTESRLEQIVADTQLFATIAHSVSRTKAISRYLGQSSFIKIKEKLQIARY